MSNKTLNTKNRSHSTFLGQRRKSFLKKRVSKVGLHFLKIHQGCITRCTMPSGAIRLTFQSKKTGRTALAYGRDFFSAFHNLVCMFNLKYA